METTTRDTLAHQFASDWLLVMENDFDSYNVLREETQALDTIQLSDKLREEWEYLAEQITELVENNISDVASLLVAQMLKGWGSYPFDLIAKHLKESN